METCMRLRTAFNLTCPVKSLQRGLSLNCLRYRSLVVAFLATLFLLDINIVQSDPTESHSDTYATGPLTQSLLNPRYFADPNGRIVYLTGSHTWNSLVDMDVDYPLHEFDFDAYLDFLVSHNHNFIRLWTWEVPCPRSDRYERRALVGPLPWLRTGPDSDCTGRPKLDLERKNPDYFERLRKRVKKAGERGVYVSVMLFEGWAVQFSPGRSSHPFLPQNNLSGISVGDDLSQIHTLAVPQVTALQEKHILSVIDVVGDLDNVLFEIVNESGIYSAAWQQHMLTYLKQQLHSRGRHLPVGMTGMIHYPPGGSNRILFESSADWVSPGWDTGRYLNDPAPANGDKVIVTDTDHLGGSAIGNRGWVWKSFTRGLNPIFMDRYEPPDSVTDDRYPLAREIRFSMGLTRLLAQRVDLDQLSPQPELASSGFALAGPGQIIVYQMDLRSVYVDLRGRTGTFQSEWLNPRTGEVALGGLVLAGTQVNLVRPNFFDDDVILILYTDSVGLNFDAAEFESRARAIYTASLRFATSGNSPKLFGGDAIVFLTILSFGVLIGAVLAGILIGRRRSSFWDN